MRGESYRPHAFLAATLGWTWALWLPVALFGLDPWSGPGRTLLYLGGIGPLLAGLWFQHRYSAGRGLRDLWVRLVDPRRAPVWLWCAAIALIPVLSLTAHSLLALTGSTLPEITLPGGSWPAAVGFAAFIFLLGPLPEEIGWRGYGLDALLDRHAPVLASLILAAVWGAWHLPLFAMEGYYADFGGPPVLWLFLWSILMKTLIMTWGYLVSERSLLLMVVFHFMVNFTGEMVVMPPNAEFVFQALLSIAGFTAAAYLMWWRRA